MAKAREFIPMAYVEEGLFVKGNFIGPAPQSPRLKKPKATSDTPRDSTTLRVGTHAAT